MRLLHATAREGGCLADYGYTLLKFLTVGVVKVGVEDKDLDVD